MNKFMIINLDKQSHDKCTATFCYQESAIVDETLKF